MIMVVLNKETLIRSVLKDASTLVFVCALGYLNYKYLGGSEVYYAISLFIAYMIMKQVIRKKDFDIYKVTEKECSAIIIKIKEMRRDD